MMPTRRRGSSRRLAWRLASSRRGVERGTSPSSSRHRRRCAAIGSRSSRPAVVSRASRRRSPAVLFLRRWPTQHDALDVARTRATRAQPRNRCSRCHANAGTSCRSAAFSGSESGVPCSLLLLDEHEEHSRCIIAQRPRSRSMAPAVALPPRRSPRVWTYTDCGTTSMAIVQAASNPIIGRAS
jgi:hypothetical protein